MKKIVKLKRSSVVTLLFSMVLASCSGSQYPDYKPSGAVTVSEPRESTVPNSHVSSEEIENEAYTGQINKVALLLPMNSQYARAAKAFEDGFQEAHRDSTLPIRPLLKTYDVGSDLENIGQVYSQALAEEADFVVGPLGNEALNKLIEQVSFTRPTLAIAQLPEKPQDSDKELQNLYGFSLSPEAEAAQVARFAYKRGLRRTRILRPDNPWGARVASAFAKEWHSLGGVIDRNMHYPPGIFDYSNVVRNLLGANASEERYKRVKNATNVNAVFDGGQNNIDFLFLVANVKQARILVPQVRFHNGHNLDIYAISSVYSGGPDPVLDLDLENVIFSELRWVLQSAKLEENKYFKGSPYQGSALDRIYDLGYETYQLVYKASKTWNNSQTLHGQTMKIHAEKNGSFEPQYDFAIIKNGVPVPLTPN